MNPALSTITTHWLADCLAVVLGLIAVVVMWREWLRSAPGGLTARGRRLDRHQALWLSRGAELAIHEALQDLTRRQLLAIDDAGVVTRTARPAGELTNLESAVLHAVETGTARTVDLPAAVNGQSADLARQGLILTPAARWLTMLPAVLIVPTLGVVGGRYIAEQLQAGGLITPAVLITIAGVLTVSYLSLPTLRTRRGDAVLFGSADLDVSLRLPGESTSNA